MSSELERRATILWRSVRPCAQGDHRFFFKFPKATFTALPSPSRSRRTSRKDS
ncbi:Hypothetical protein FKW44_024811 [Caligus rogercresseyi]|uniref:Uncharacterized protein n=1 Tax=Caligus rogercresseyi TaxID=217165 RepID=A0A7T8JTJ8_CALRO|nr:Hypothetical protein FKW44_024811 [Caligus rogercresseyi]